jgi:hypothetical protein
MGWTKGAGKAAISSNQNTLRVWDKKSGQLLPVYEPTPSELRRLS